MQRPCQGQVRVKYKRLERGTFVRLTPQNSEFQSQVAEHMETLLQETLMQHTALSEGDWLEVPFDGVVHKLQARLPADEIQMYSDVSVKSPRSNSDVIQMYHSSHPVLSIIVNHTAVSQSNLAFTISRIFIDYYELGNMYYHEILDNAIFKY